MKSEIRNLKSERGGRRPEVAESLLSLSDFGFEISDFPYAAGFWYFRSGGKAWISISTIFSLLTPAAWAA